MTGERHNDKKNRSCPPVPNRDSKAGSRFQHDGPAIGTMTIARPSGLMFGAMQSLLSPYATYSDHA